MLQAITSRVVANQLLYTAGYALTSGSFLTYFAADLGANSLTIACLLSLPDLLGVFSILTPLIISFEISRKSIFLNLSILSRILLFALPLTPLISSDLRWPIFILILGISSVLQMIAYVAYLSWLSLLAPEEHWGTFFAKRNISKLCILVILPLLAASLRDQLKTSGSDEWIYWGYCLIFTFGNLLQLTSLAPISKLPAHPHTDSHKQPDSNPTDVSNQSIKQHAMFNQWQFFRAIMFSWWLAAFQGLTQAVFFIWIFQYLKLPLLTYYLLQGLMYSFQIPWTWLAGLLGPSYGYRRTLMISTWMVSPALLFWIASWTGNWIWLVPAYVIWGVFGAVNLSSQNFLLTIAPRANNTFHWALYRHGAGLCAGLTGLAGGWLLMQSETSTIQIGSHTMNQFQIIQLLIIVSLIGRMIAPCWLIGSSKSVNDKDRLEFSD